MCSPQFRISASSFRNVALRLSALLGAVSGMFAVFLEVISGPQRLKVGEMKTGALLLMATQVEGAARDDVVNVPLPII